MLPIRGLTLAGKPAAKTGARLVCDTFAPHLERGHGRVSIERLPYFGEMVVDFLDGAQLLVLVRAQPPVSFFACPPPPGQDSVQTNTTAGSGDRDNAISFSSSLHFTAASPSSSQSPCAQVEKLLLNPAAPRNMPSLKLSDLFGVYQRSAHFVDAIDEITTHDFIDIE